MVQLDIVKKSLSYTALGGVIYLSFRYLPNNKYDPKEIVVMTFLSVAVYAVIDYLCSHIRSGSDEPETKSGEKLNDLLESFSSLSNDACSCSRPEGFASVSTDNKDKDKDNDSNKTNSDDKDADNESYLQGNDDVVSRLKEENEKLREVVREFRQEAKDGPSDLQKRMDPFNNKGTVYSTDPNNVTTVDQRIPSSIRKVGKGGNGSRRTDGVMKSEMVYHDHNSLPVAEGYKSRDYEYGYSFLPPEKWYPQPAHPPVCVTERETGPQPMMTTGLPADLKEWDASRRITPPANINVDYVQDKLNSGR